MPTKKPASIYRSLLRDALRITRERKNLWVFGLFAAFLSTGGVGEMAARGWHRLAVTRDVCGEIFRGSFAGASVFGAVVRTILQFQPAHATLILSAVILLVLSLVAVSVMSQGVILAAVGSKPIADARAVEIAKASFWHLLALNVLHKATQALLILFASLPTVLIVVSPRGSSALIAFLAYLVFFPLMLVVAAVFMIASVGVSRTNAHALDAIHRALSVFRTHWMAAFELGLILFLCVIAASAGFVVLISLLAIPYMALLSLALISGNAVAFVLANVLGPFALLLLMATLAGATTTFQYAAWVRFCAHASGPIKKTISKAHRVWRGK